ncbi:GNAT family N-acetyltransferase [Glycomyces tarimensis]
MPQHASLSGRDIHKIVTLAHRCTEVDDIEPFNEQTTLAMHRPASPELKHFVVPHDETIIGYAQVEAVGDGASAELAVGPDHRRRGLGRALLREVIDSLEAQITSVKVWAHGDLPAASALATSEGFIRDRVLFKLSRDMEGFVWPSAWPSRTRGDWPVGDGPALNLPEGVSLRAFEVGADEPEWLRVNAAAFADHPEQGRWTMEDLRARQREAWFDPEGLLVAEDAEGLLGFHWTKVEGGVGEIYVLGVDPRAQGTGLGKVLTLAGLAHLATRGIRQVDLYTDESNARAVELYRSLGFAIVRSDVQWAKRPV